MNKKMYISPLVAMELMEAEPLMLAASTDGAASTDDDTDALFFNGIDEPFAGFAAERVLGINFFGD